MIVLDTTAKSLEVVLAGAVATTELPVVAAFVDVTPTTYVSGEFDAVTTGTTAVAAVPAPAASTQRQVKLLTVFNADTAAATVRVRLNAGGTLRVIVTVTLAVGSTLVYTDGEGFRVIDASGAIVASGGSGGGGAPAAHHTTHETGGTDVITALPASVLTSGTIAGARLPAYYDYLEGTPANPAADTVRLYAVDFNGFSFLEERDSAGRTIRPNRDTVAVGKVDEAGGIARGQVVRVSGASGSNRLLKKALATDRANTPGVGLAMEAGALNAFIRVLTSGLLTGLDTSAFTEGARVFLSATTAGGLTETAPLAPNLTQRMGYVLRTHATLGEIAVIPATALSESAWAATHASMHQSGGRDPLAIDTLAAASDITSLNVSVSAHGLAPKLPGTTTTFLRGDGTYATPPAGGGFTVINNTDTGTKNDWAPTGITTANTLILWAGTADATVTGILATVGLGGATGQLVTIRNVGTKTITFTHNSGSSVYYTRLSNTATSAGTPVAPGGYVTYQYQNDGTTLEWKMVTHEQGAWLSQPFNASDFTAGGSMTWTVAAGNVHAYRYRLTGRTLFIEMVVVSTTLGGTAANVLYMKVPGGFLGSAFEATGSNFYLPNSTPWAMGAMWYGPSSPGTDRISIYKGDFGGTSWVLGSNTHIYSNIVIEVQ